MSESDSSDTDSSSEELSSSFHILRGKLKQIDHELSKSIESFQHIRKVAKTIEKLTEKKELHVEYPLLHKYLTLCKKENRLNHNGSKILLTKEEAKHFNLKEGWNSVYDICSHLKK